MSKILWTITTVGLFIIAAIFAFFGVIYILASPVQETQARLTVGIILVVVALVLVGGGIYTLKTKLTATVQAVVELPQNFDYSSLRCRDCGAPLDRTAVTFDPKSGALYIKCAFCKSEYEMVEKPKW